jgi:transcriptional regulator with PAS, ATPase and Fis domain
MSTWMIVMETPTGEVRRKSLSGLRKGESVRIEPRTAMTQSWEARESMGFMDATAEVRWEDTGTADEPGRLPRYWIRSLSPQPIRIGDLECREARWPPYVRLRIGETLLTLTQTQAPLPQASVPAGKSAWLSESLIGLQMLQRVKKASMTTLPIYLCGETGVGKEVLAHLVHTWSPRASGPFVPLHCGALPLSLAESELFGHRKGSFTGASTDRPGALLQAHRGTLFLDEVGDLPPEIQVKLLRFLENGEIRPVGSDRAVHADVRIVCATHHSLQKLVEEGRFRQDLYYRIASVTIPIPSLRERPEDIRFLARLYAKDLGKTLSDEALALLSQHSWPGNVRELKHTVERAAGGTTHTLLGSDDFDFMEIHKTSDWKGEAGLMLPKLRDMEKWLLIRALQTHRGNRALAAKELGIARSTVFEMIRRHGLQRQYQLIMKVVK